MLTSLAGARVAIVHQGAGSTIDHFLRGPLEGIACPVVELDSSCSPTAEGLRLLEQSAFIVVVRYLPRRWLGPLARMRKRGSNLVFLMDDDLLDPAAILALPNPYRQRLWQKITRRRHRIPDLFDRLWVSSEALALKYADLGAELLPLRPHRSLLADRARLQLAYLGTSVHRQEFEWLLHLLELVQRQHAHTHVDVFGDIAINRLFRHLPRVRVIHPMGWSNYLAETGNGRLHLLLCPLLESPFNGTRAAVKFIDAARTGAAGLFSDRPPYRGFIRDGIDGLLLADGHHHWLEAIDRLLDRPQEQARLSAACRQRALALSEQPVQRGDPEPIQ